MPTVDLGVDETICNGANITLNAGIADGYIWTNGAVTQTISIGAGTHSVTISNVYGCTATDDITISEWDAITTSAILVATDCNNIGSVDISVTGGLAPYGYSWDNGFQTEDIFNLANGSYTVTITDSENCEMSSTFTIDYDGIEVDNIVTGISCEGLTDGEIDLLISNGTLPYSYMWSNGETTQDLYNLPLGTYSCTITDGANCQVVITDSITTADMLTIDALQISNTEATAIVTGGVISPFGYSWTGPANFYSPFQSIQNLVMGATYFVSVSYNGCGVSDSVTIVSMTSIAMNSNSDNFGTSDFNDQSDYMTDLNSIDKNNSISVYPNPSTDGRFFVNLEELDFENLQIDVIDALGRSVFNTTVEDNFNRLVEIQLGDINAGIYSMRIITHDKNVYTKKISIVD